jgi:hypothetical protein
LSGSVSKKLVLLGTKTRIILQKDASEAGIFLQNNFDDYAKGDDHEPNPSAGDARRP